MKTQPIRKRSEINPAVLISSGQANQRAAVEEQTLNKLKVAQQKCIRRLGTSRRAYHRTLKSRRAAGFDNRNINATKIEEPEDTDGPRRPLKMLPVTLCAGFRLVVHVIRRGKDGIQPQNLKERKVVSTDNFFGVRAWTTYQ